MVEVLHLLIAGYLFLVPALLLLVHVTRWLWYMRDKMFVHLGTAKEFYNILENIEKLEKPEEQLARLAKLNPKEIAIEIEKTGLLGVLMGVAKELSKNMEADLRGR